MDFVRADALSGKSPKLFQRNKEGRGVLKSCPSWLGVRNGVDVGLANDKDTAPFPHWYLPSLGWRKVQGLEEYQGSCGPGVHVQTAKSPLPPWEESIAFAFSNEAAL